MGCKLSYCTNKRIFSEHSLSNTDALTKFPSVDLWNKDVGIYADIFMQMSVYTDATKWNSNGKIDFL